MMRHHYVHHEETFRRVRQVLYVLGCSAFFVVAVVMITLFVGTYR